MKIAIVHDYITKVGGAQNVLKVIHEIFPDAPVYTLLYDREGTRGQFDEYEIITSSLQHKPAFWRKRIKLLLNSFPQAIEEFDFTDFDVVLSSSNSFAHGVITRPETLHLCYCYSPMRYAWDWHAEYLRENHLDHGLLSLVVRGAMKKMRQWDFLAASRADHWIAISETVRQRLAKYYRVDSEVIYPPADIDELLDAKLRTGDYYLIMSTLTPYKKIDIAIEAFNNNGKKLIIAGEGSDMARLRALATSNNLEFTGYVSDEQKKELLLGCKAFVFPGEEDFGLTPVEAMACGKPVVALGHGGVSETVIDKKTGIFFDEPTAASLNTAIEWLEANLAKIEPGECRERAKKFSKEIFMADLKKFVEKKYREKHEAKS